MDSHDDTAIIALCRKMRAVCQEEDRIIREAEFAPDIPSALEAAQTRLAAAIARTKPPTTPDGIRALAEVAMEFVYDEDLKRPHVLADWFKLAALLAAAGKHDRFPPISLPKH